MSSVGKRHSLPHSHSLSYVPDAAIPAYQRRKSSAKVSFHGALFSPKEDEEFDIPTNQEAAFASRDNGGAETHLPRQDVTPADFRAFENLQSLSGIANAIRSADEECLVELLERGEDLHEIDENGCNPVHYACLTGNSRILKILLERDCDSNSGDYWRRTPLHKAVLGSKTDILFLLLKTGCIPDVKDKDKGRTPVHYAALLPKLDCLKILLENLRDNAAEKERILRLSDKDGRTALHLASIEGSSEAVGHLLAEGADVDATDSEGMTPVHLALLAHRGKRRCAKVLSKLLEVGADLELEGGENKETLAHFAARTGCAVCLRFIHEKGANITTKNGLGQTPLHISAFENKSEATLFFVSKGADLEALDQKGCRPLHMAILGECPNIIDILVSSGADTNATDTNGFTYVQFAITRKRVQAFQALIRSKKVSLPDGSGEDILHYCSALGSVSGISFLLDQGWDVNIKDSKGRTALHRALNHGHEHLATVLINNNADPCALDDTEASPLHYAVRWGGSDAILRLLLKRKANLGCRDRLGRTPLHYAASKFSVMSDLYILLGGGSDLNVQDNMGLTPLHLAARLGNESLVRILLDSGAKHDIADVDNFLPIDHAKEKDNKNIIKRLDNHSKTAPAGEKGKTGRKEEGRQEKGGRVAHQETTKLPTCLSSHRKSLAW